MGLSVFAFALQLAPAYAVEQVADMKEYGCDRLTLLVATPTGGSLDKMTRALAEPLSEAFGVPVAVENKTGGQSMLAYTYLETLPDNGCVIGTATVGNIVNHVLQGTANFSLDDWDFFNVQWVDAAMIIASSDGPVQDFDGFVAGLREKEALAYAAVVGTGTYYIYLDLLDRLGVPLENVRNVSYRNGAEMRQSLLGGQTDFTIAPIGFYEDIRDNVRAIAIFENQQVESIDAPTINQALQSEGVTVPIVYGSMRSWMVPAEMSEQYPERYKVILDGFEAVLNDEEVIGRLQDANVGYDWNGPEASKVLVEDFRSLIAPYVGAEKKQ